MWVLKINTDHEAWLQAPLFTQSLILKMEMTIRPQSEEEGMKHETQNA